uniref:Uncharacterized protein n=1 Tax=Tanacetum cinerariifolium TaxID=118510 RepID=A0A699J1T3_TANCI|nr:hypothetical protein [Tanacetum cinerariifolium]
MKKLMEDMLLLVGTPNERKSQEKGTIKTGKLDFEYVYFVRELKFNLFSVSQMYDKKNSVLFNDTECIVLSPNCKLIDESQVLLRVPRKNNMYSVDLKNIVPKGGLTCLFMKATSDESKLWHRSLGHLNFKTMNKLLKGNLAEAVNTACYVQNRVLVVKPHNKTPYELFHGYTPTLSFMRPFRCPINILNTKDHLGKFNGKANEGFFVGYSLNSKAFRVFNSKTRIVEENLHIRFSKNTPNVVGSGPDWLFDINALTRIMNYEPIVAGTQSDSFAGTKASDNAGQARKETEHDDGFKPLSDDGKKVDKDPCKGSTVNAVGTNVVNAVGENISSELPFDPDMPALEDISTFNFLNEDEDDDTVADINNLDTTIQQHKQETCLRIWRNMDLLLLFIKEKTIKTFKTACLLTFYHKKNPKRAISTKWVFRNKKDERGIVIRNKARLVTQGHAQDEAIDYDELFAPVARIKAIRLFLAYVSFKDFVVYQMDVKSAYLYGKIEEEVYVCQPLEFEDPNFPDIVYKVEKALYGLHQAPRAWYKGDILLVQVYVDDIIFEVKNANTPLETQKPLLKDEDGKEVDVHMYRSMIGSLMYLTTSRPEIMFAVYAYARYQVNPKVLHLYAVKRIFSYLKGQPKLGIWYPKDSPFDLVAYTNSDYAGASLDRKSTTGGYQYLKSRIVSWQCKK